MARLADAQEGSDGDPQGGGDEQGPCGKFDGFVHF